MTKWHVIVKKLNILELKSMHIPEGGKFRDRKSSMPRPTKFKRHNLFELGLILVLMAPDLSYLTVNYISKSKCKKIWRLITSSGYITENYGHVLIIEILITP